MNIEEFTNHPIESYIKTERYLNDGSRSKIRNTTSAHTSPLSNIDSFNLKIVLFEDIVIEDFGIEREFFIPSNSIIIHPDLIESDIFNRCIHQFVDDIAVVPTASGRTTFSINNKFFIKLAYLEILGRIPRHIPKEKIQSACEVTRILKKVIDSGKSNSKFSILREDKGRVAYLPCLDGYYELGVLFREGLPYPKKNGFHALIPFFSLFSKEYVPGSDWVQCANQDEPLLIQLFHRQRQFNSLDDFVLDEIIKPLLNTYFDALILGGIELEAHAQNMLIAIDNKYQVMQIVCRDLESAGRDISLMQHLNIEYLDIAKHYKYITKTNKEENEKYSKYQRIHSFMFDFKLGEYILTPLIDCICEYVSNVNRYELIKKIKTFNNQFIQQLPSDFFPEEWCDYDDLVWDNDEKIYNWHENPKYR